MKSTSNDESEEKRIMLKRTVVMLTIVVLMVQVVLIAPPASGQADKLWPTESWATSTPEAQGMRSGELANYFATWSQPHFNLDSMIVVRHGHIVAEAYGPLTQPEDIREMASCSKSITSALVGVMLQEGLLGSIDTPVLDLFPDRTIVNVDARKQALTVRDLLVMGSGVECNDMEVGDPALATSNIMETTDDWLQYALDLPIAADPGTQWYYCNAAVHILSGIITELTGMSALDFAAEKLFAPLGITDYAGTSSPTGITLGYSDLKLAPRDMAKFGYLYLNDGQWDGQQIIPADYARASLGKQIATPWPDTVYGYLWWRVDSINLSFALGYAGQYIMVMPDKDMVVVVTSSMTDNIRVGIQAYPMFFSTVMLPTADEALPDNPDGFNRLASVIQGIHEPAAQPVPAMPALAATISGRMYGLSATNLFMSSDQYRRFATYSGLVDSIGVNWFTLSFDDSAQAQLTLGFTDNEAWTLPVGLDGLYRVSEGRLGTVGAKGEWLGEATFRIYLMERDNLFVQRFDFNFMPGGVDIISYDYTSGGAIALQGVAMQ
jgi:CubicO group peptidase (beta-lactamase class C family)